MANSYYGIYLHVVFAVKHRRCLIPPENQTKIHSYIGGVLSNKGHVPIRVGGVDNHVHILFSYNPAKELIPNLIRDLKTSVSTFINNEWLTEQHFAWQNGYACISASKSHIEPLIKYIEGQHEHHYGCSLQDEIKRLLDKAGVEYDEQYLFDDI